jgi:Uncharacterized alpha/beta hydrolase domain (DUF2235)
MIDALDVLYCATSPNIVITTAIATTTGTDGSGARIDYFIDGALGLTIKEKCVEAYEFIVHYCFATDGRIPEIYLFGFSRGAHTVCIMCVLCCKR